ncbi:hypothetical protein COO60DRAFT_1520687 [Scenedesmus sp. NREL 46B-D3]|nr:hypothetical protein COO60DRAFT_1520687 [Scenedesmus sp. NREL 46B-D3]
MRATVAGCCCASSGITTCSLSTDTPVTRGISAFNSWPDREKKGWEQQQQQQRQKSNSISSILQPPTCCMCVAWQTCNLLQCASSLSGCSMHFYVLPLAAGSQSTTCWVTHALVAQPHTHGTALPVATCCRSALQLPLPYELSYASPAATVRLVSMLLSLLRTAFQPGICRIALWKQRASIA